MNPANGETSREPSWRLLRDGAQSGAWNMAVDEAMLWAHSRGLAPPTLRFYSWNPACLSLGRLQKQWPDAVSEAKIDVVRRLSGGRAVWHDAEITYSVVVREAWLPLDARGVEGAYRWLSAGFLRALQSLGLPVEMAHSGVRTNGSNCFAASAGCDFVAGGKKLIGAAQFRRDDTILQHGSLLLSLDEAAWRRFAGGPMDGATSLDTFDASLKAETVIKALSQHFVAAVGGRWLPGEKEVTMPSQALSERETRLAQWLFEQKYTRDAWTLRAEVSETLGEGIENALS